jgi:glycosyltransferase involved in cell wall biosynthesis
LSHADKNANRTGLFFTAYNILNKFEQQNIFDISIYISPQDGWEQSRIDSLKKEPWISKFNCIEFRNEQIPRTRIKLYKQNFETIKSFRLKMVYILKIVLDCLRIVKYRFWTNNKKTIQTKLKFIDVYFSPIFAIPDEIKRHKRIKKFILLHDTILLDFAEYYPGHDSPLSWFSRILDSLDKDTYCMCNSMSTKNDFLRHASDKLDESKMFVVYIGTSQNFKPMHDSNKLFNVLQKYKISHKQNDEYIFSFCTLEPRKNLVFTVKCFIKFIKKHGIQNLYFYLGGPSGDLVIKSFNEKIENFNVFSNKIVRLGYVDDEDGNTFYSNALFFTYISQYEGFGMPPLEAMQAGVPVITSNNSSLPEVVGDAAIMIDYNSEEQCIKAFEDLYFNEDLRKQYIQKGIKRAKMFSWEKTAAKIVEVMKSQ